MVKRRRGLRHVRLLASASVICSLAAWVIAPSATETAVANGDTRTIHLYHTHTGETIDATFRVNGQYDGTVLRQLNHFLRDWRNNDETNMDPRLFDAVWEAYRTAGATDRIQIYSAYRSPETNAMLRRRSHAVAEHSQHMLGRAMDTTMPGFPMQRVREAGMKLEHGGVGWYPSGNFVHLDVGSVRAWPRMSYDQLVRLFPDGKTVHIASNGQTLPGYEEARAEIGSRGTEVPPSQESGGFFAWLFGGGNTAGAAHEDEEDRRTAVASAAPPPVQQQPARAVPVQQQPVQAQSVQAQPAAAPQPAALAYAGAPSQPLDGRVQVQDQQENRQVASLEPADGRAPTSLGGVLPLPPRRPADLAAAVEIPLPPVRPNTLAAVETASIRFSDVRTAPLRHDEIGALITATASGVPMLRKSGLPAIITQGTGGHRDAPGQALAFAGTDAVAMDDPPHLRAVPEPIARPTNLVKPMALRLGGQRGMRKHAGAPRGPVAVADAPVMIGPRLTGLRKAAHLMVDKASL